MTTQQQQTTTTTTTAKEDHKRETKQTTDSMASYPNISADKEQPENGDLSFVWPIVAVIIIVGIVVLILVAYLVIRKKMANKKSKSNLKRPLPPPSPTTSPKKTKANRKVKQQHQQQVVDKNNGKIIVNIEDNNKTLRSESIEEMSKSMAEDLPSGSLTTIKVPSGELRPVDEQVFEWRSKRTDNTKDNSRQQQQKKTINTNEKSNNKVIDKDVEQMPNKRK
ncbi:uncharacterized protein LOC128962528 [Oppia nitens]|uniref:uncharacterized protein LOC128962528 n=1 Tax=Oppia nitens TaxID=1686743 RepID=UPI0023DB475B|nr:uncharacterized protein LOC128962528 [Oppia nitens]